MYRKQSNDLHNKSVDLLLLECDIVPVLLYMQTTGESKEETNLFEIFLLVSGK